MQEIVVEEIERSRHYMHTEEDHKATSWGYYQSRMKVMEMGSKLNRMSGYHSCGSG